MLRTWTIDEKVAEEERERMRKIIEEKLSGGEGEEAVGDLMSCRNKNVFVWSPSDEVVYCFAFSDERAVSSIQSLALTKPPVFEVRSLLLSPSGRYLAVYGDRGASVAELPQKWTGGQRKECFCRSWALDERFFVCNQKIGLLEARWHPGDAEDRHLVLLTNDNCLRIYRVDAPRAAVQLINLSNDLKLSPLAASLGESAVSFDFGLAESKNEEEKETELSEAVWPLFVLKGNGDLLLVYSNLENEFVSRRVIGPLTMLPAAEDNYEIDAAKLICLDTLPSVLVIASASGSVYNCVVLEEEERRKPTVFVYECIELNEETYAESNPNSVVLYKDPLKSDRYFVSHLNGVHAIGLTLVDQMQAESFDDFDKSSVEHIICTRPVQSQSSTLKPIGLTVSLFKGQSHLRVLLSSGDSFVQRLPLTSKVTKFDHSSNGNGQALGLDDATIEFSAHIAEILRRERSAPLLKSAEGEVSAEKRLQLLLNTTTIFRQEYLTRMNVACTLIARRVKNLAHEKQMQLSELRRLSEERAKLCEKLTSLSAKYDATLEKQSAVTSRLERLLDRVHNQQAELSEAERETLQRMRVMKSRAKGYAACLEKIRLKQRFREESEEEERPRGVGHHELKKIKRALESEGEAIALLLSQLRKAL